MEYRILGKSGMKVPVLTLGTANFGADPASAQHLVDICLESGLNMFDSAMIDAQGTSEEILGKAIRGKRDQVIISTTGPNEVNISPSQLVRSIEDNLRRLQTDYIDLFQLHGFDAQPPVEETLNALDQMVKSGKIRHIGCSNFSGWQLMKSLAISERGGWASYVSHQAYYSLVGRDYEWELMPLGVDQNVSCVVWSPLGWGRLTGGKQAKAEEARPRGKPALDEGPHIAQELLYRVIDVLEMVSKQTGKTSTQISLNWLLSRPTVATLIIGARNEKQLREKIGATDWTLTPEYLERLSEASATPRIYPYWHPAGFDPAPGP
jgi:aryl-alcohol dehydrogenase-like predicted oxidoreductase